MPTAAPLLHSLLPLLERLPLRAFAILRTGRFHTGLFRSRRPHPTPARRPRTRPLQRRPAAPSPPQPSSPTRPKNPAQANSRRPAPRGGGPARVSSPFTPAQSPQPPAQPRPHHPEQTSPIRATDPSTQRRAWLGASPIQPKCTAPQAPPKHTPLHLKSFLEETLTARETPISTPPTTHPIRTLHAQNTRSTLAPRRPLSPLLRSHYSPLSPLPFRLHPPPQPDILNPPPIWAVICGGHTRS